MALTKKQIDAAKYRSGQDVRWDGAMPGFGLRIYASGAKSYVLKFRTRNGRVRLATVGRVGVLTLKQARDRAREMLVEISDGKDPVEERRQPRAQTFRAFIPEYLGHVRAHNKRWRDTARALGHRWIEEKEAFEPDKEYPGPILPVFGPRPLTEIRRADVRRLHTKMKDTPYAANRTVALLSAMFSFAGVTPNPAAAKTARRRDGIELFKERPRTRFLDRDELRRLIDAADAESNLFVRAAIRLLLFTGCRKSEILRARWEHVDLDRGTLRLPDTKAGHERVVALSAPAVEVLKGLPRYAENDHVFPGRNGRPLADFQRPWRRIRKAAGLEDVRVHDLRRTIGSLLLQDGVPMAHVSALLGHSSVRVTERVYAHLEDAQPRLAAERFGAMLRVVEGGKR